MNTWDATSTIELVIEGILATGLAMSNEQEHHPQVSRMTPEQEKAAGERMDRLVAAMTVDKYREMEANGETLTDEQRRAYDQAKSKIPDLVANADQDK